MRRTSFAKKNCPIARALEVVGDWWTLLIVKEAMFAGTCSFEDFRRSLGIASNILTTRLDHLVTHEIMERRSDPATPGRPTYRLTEKGLALWPVLASLLQWGNDWTGAGPTARLLHTSCGHPVEPAQPHCPACSERPAVAQVKIQPLIPSNAKPGR
jgi:DNA-binding HxlR family transcriptional regulator